MDFQFSRNKRFTMIYIIELNIYSLKHVSHFITIILLYSANRREYEFNIRFKDGFERSVSILMPDANKQQPPKTCGWMLSLHIPNLFLVHIFAYFRQLFHYFLHFSCPYIETT